jgi:hypothetical protein
MITPLGLLSMTWESRIAWRSFSSIAGSGAPADPA